MGDMDKRASSVEWDGVVRGAGGAGEGFLQRSPLSPILFFISLARTILKMEEGIRRAIPGLEVEINSYVVDDIAMTIFDGDGIMGMGRIVAKRGEIMEEVEEIGGIPLEWEKEGTIVFGRKGRKAEKVNWLGIILDTTVPRSPDGKSEEGKANARGPQWLRQLLGHDPAELEAGIHRHDKDHCAVRG